MKPLTLKQQAFVDAYLVEKCPHCDSYWTRPAGGRFFREIDKAAEGMNKKLMSLLGQVWELPDCEICKNDIINQKLANDYVSKRQSEGWKLSEETNS